MKFFASLLILCAASFAFTACTTDANRRDLYSPTQGSGYWTDRENGMHRGVAGVSRNVQ